MSLEKLKKQQQALNKSMLDRAQNMGNGNFTRNDDDSYWKPVPDEAGNGTFVIRFLPAPEGEENEWIHYYEYKFKYLPTGKFYYGRSLSTLSKPDPVADKKKELKAAGREDLAKQMGRSDTYVAGIRVIKDNNNPDNNGKTFRYKFGKQIFNKIVEAMKDDPDVGKVGFNPFDPWSGKNFVVKMIKKDKFPNYENSTFAENSTPLGTDEEIEVIWKGQYSLASENTEDKYESYDVLKAKLDGVMGVGSTSSSSNSSKSNSKSSSEVLDDDIDDILGDGGDDIDDLLKGNSSTSSGEVDVDELLKGI